MKQRVISGVIIAALIVGAGFLGGFVLAALIMVCSMIGFQELTRSTGVLETGQKVNPLTGFALVMTAAYYLGLMALQVKWGADPQQMVFASDFFATIIIVGAFLGLMTIYVLTFPKFRSEQVMAAFFSFIYAPVLMGFVYRTRTLPYGIFMYALIFVCSSVCDTCALAAGMAFGKHKMAPVLSPKKSVEGGIGGVAGAALLGAVYAAVFNQQIVGYAIICGAGALISMVGDLAASAVKRDKGIKDYGKLIPGHGGILDRFDSVIFTAPIIYFLSLAVLGLY